MITNREFELSPGGPRRLTITWHDNYQVVTLKLGDQVLGHVKDRKTLRQGREFTLDDGSTISLRLQPPGDLVIKYNGKLVPAIEKSFRDKVNLAAMMLLAFGIMAGYVSIPTKHPVFGGNLWVGISISVFFLVSAFFVWRGIPLALYLATGYLAVNLVGIVCQWLSPGRSLPSFSLLGVMFIPLCYTPVVLALGPITVLWRQKKVKSPSQPSL